MLQTKTFSTDGPAQKSFVSSQFPSAIESTILCGECVEEGFAKEEIVTVNQPSDPRCSNQLGVTFIILGSNIMKLFEFTEERRNIHQNIRAVIRDMRLAYGKK